MEKIVKRYVDSLLALQEAVAELRGGDTVHFFEAVAEEMRQRGISEKRITNVLKGAYWRRKNWAELMEQLKESPSILDIKEPDKAGEGIKNPSCWWCKNHRKAFIHVRLGEDKDLCVHYCLATNKPYDVVDPGSERNCDKFEELED